MQVFSRDVTEEEWQRFKRYASFVRQLQVVVQNQEVFIDESVWKALAVKSCGQPLFPYLEDLTDFKVGSRFTGTTELVLLASPTLRRLYIDTCAYSIAEDEVTTEFMNALSRVLARIHTLAITWPPEAPLTNPSVSLLQSSHLRSLTLHTTIHISNDSLRWLTGFSGLHELSLDVGNMDEIETPLDQVFPEMRVLDVGGSLRRMRRFLEAITPSRVESICLDAWHIRETPPPIFLAEMFQIYDTIPLSLQEFRLIASDDAEVFTIGRHPFLYLSNASVLLQPLYSKCNLQRLTFEFLDIYAHVRDGDLRAIDHTIWPNLTSFKFTYGSWVTGMLKITGAADRLEIATTAPSITALAEFTRAHPKLERLALPSIQHSPDSAVPHTIDVAQSHDLKYIVVRWFKEDTPLYGIAMALDVLFPNLELSKDTMVTRSEGRGDELTLLLLGMQAGRRRALAMTYTGASCSCNASIQRFLADTV